MIRYIPKGGMCANCDSRHSDCSWMDFSAMRVIATDGELKIVKCSNYERSGFVYKTIDRQGCMV